MKLELDAKLCKEYPKIFMNRHAPMTQTAMCWGFDHNDGWYNIINMMCANIQSHIDWTRTCRLQALRYNRALIRACSGDYSNYNRMSLWEQRQITEEMSMPEPQLKPVPEACPQVVAVQVKEKFGTLRFYYSGGDDIVSGIVRMAESISSVTCEICGDAGNSSSYGWIRTLCEKHQTS